MSGANLEKPVDRPYKNREPPLFRSTVTTRPPIIMARIILTLAVFCLFASAFSQEEDGQWMDDVSGNPEVMGFDPSDEVQADQQFDPAPAEDQAGEWVDDVSGNQIVMGEDPASQDPGLNGNIYLHLFSSTWL